MKSYRCDSLIALLRRFKDNNKTLELQSTLNKLENNQYANNVDLIAIYKQSLRLADELLWSPAPSDELIELYQKSFCELESLLQKTGNTKRHHFVIVIPVADRPIQLEECLNSLLALCQSYNYGDYNGKHYSHVQVIVADDSRHHSNIKQHKNLCDEFNNNGLVTEYFGIEQQIAQINALPLNHRQSLKNILGSYAENLDKHHFSYKGAAITRNITYLKLKQISINQPDTNYLFYFIDSDQEFKINIYDAHLYRNVYAINYFYQLDEIFTNTDTSILTGKVVGDPPVSPSVMVSKFLDDVINFFNIANKSNPDEICPFHETSTPSHDEAAYHDMANLFGFKETNSHYDYLCKIHGEHNLAGSLAEFAGKLNSFFDGEHPTRVSYYQHEDRITNSEQYLTKSARTIYTGNYIFKPENLKYFISFANLKLRMAGPTLGRIIKSEISSQFVSANLPMLHKRTLPETGESEFRPGVKHSNGYIDLSDEFERQFFGDVMLFSISKITEQGYPNKIIPAQALTQLVKTTLNELLLEYRQKHVDIITKLTKLKDLLFVSNDWLNSSDHSLSLTQINQFISNIEHNFGHDSKSYKLINDTRNTEKRQQQIIVAIMDYHHDREAWEHVIS